MLLTPFTPRPPKKNKKNQKKTNAIDRNTNNYLIQVLPLGANFIFSCEKFRKKPRGVEDDGGGGEGGKGEGGLLSG